MPDFVVRNKETGKFLHRMGDCNTSPNKWKAETVEKARVYRSRGAVTSSIGKPHGKPPVTVTRSTCWSCHTPINKTIGHFCPRCGRNNKITSPLVPAKVVPDNIEVLELTIGLKVVDCD